jgi:septal ring factor EnvC (AmiA/AmiB activator)
MIDLLIKDLDKEMQEAEVNEKDAQKDYETMMEEASAKRAADVKLQTEKEALKASTEGELEAEKDKKTVTVKDLMATGEYLASLHKECDWLLSSYDARKTARTSEIEALGQAKAVLLPAALRGLRPSLAGDGERAHYKRGCGFGKVNKQRIPFSDNAVVSASLSL